jgi:hypothetical protein
MRPFESWAELEAVAARLGPHYGPMILFAAATGLRPGEWIALERRDVDRAARVVHVRRSFSYGRLKRGKTEASLRAVPLQAIALEALDLLPPRLESPLLFPSPRGGYLDLHNFRARAWKGAQRSAGIEPLRRPYDLRHTFATFALRAGLPLFDLCRYLGTSLTMVDRHYGHLARDAREYAIALLDAHAAGEGASLAWTAGGRRPPHPRKRRPPETTNEQGLLEKPTPGLEPGTPSLRERRVRDGRARPGTRGHVSPGDRTVSPPWQWTGVPAHARAHVPVSYPRRHLRASDVHVQLRADALDGSARRLLAEVDDVGGELDPDAAVLSCRPDCTREGDGEAAPTDGDLLRHLVLDPDAFCAQDAPCAPRQ